MSEFVLFRGSNQPARRSFDITEVTIRGGRVPVATRDAHADPFCVLTEFSRLDGRAAAADLLVVAPLSGHVPILLRDLVIALLPSFRVYVTDWINVRYIAPECGSFGLDANISCVAKMIRRLRPAPIVLAVCQGGIPALAAAALLGAEEDPHAPQALVLIAVPVDPLANRTRVVRLLRQRSMTWFEHHAITKVPHGFPGQDRRVYPAHAQLAALWAYLLRSITEANPLRAKLLHDDGDDPLRFPFLDLYTSIMDLDASFFLENIKSVYHDCAIGRGALRWSGRPVDLKAIRRTALLTIEGEWDDIAAPGQTSAAHGFCASVPANSRRSVVVPGCGHFALFHGETWRKSVLPIILEFCGVEGEPKRRPS